MHVLCTGCNFVAKCDNYCPLTIVEMDNKYSLILLYVL